jgi:hypothetical protein
LDTTHETLLASGSHAQLQAKTIAGALYGLEAFAQLVQTSCGVATVPALFIEDRPTRHWRGVVVDSDTSMDSASALEKIIAHMAHVKLNLLHWRLVSPPGTDEAGMLQRVIAFASLHGIQVVLGGTDILDHVLINKTASICYPTSAAAPAGPAISHWQPILRTLSSSHPRQLVQLGWRRRDSKGSKFMCWSRTVQLLGSVLGIDPRGGRRLLQMHDENALEQFDDSLAGEGEWGEDVPDEGELKARLREEIQHAGQTPDVHASAHPPPAAESASGVAHLRDRQGPVGTGAPTAITQVPTVLPRQLLPPAPPVSRSR